MEGIEGGIKTIGRLLYVDPSNISFDGQNPHIDQSSTKIFNPLEDYCISVDLFVILTERQACGLGKYTNQSNYTIHFTTANKTISFFHGSNSVTNEVKTENGVEYEFVGGGQLTTKYTDIDLLYPEGNTDECLGIESINITYESWQYPIVTIKFIDVRGASVFSMAEYNLQNSGDLHMEGPEKRNKVMLYRSFFTFPYPLFVLKVKGFYGMGATFYLTIEDVHLNFDSASGNFEITAKFIGMMYRIYTDLPMLYVAIAPYMERGREHWQNMVQNKIFCFKNESGGYQRDMVTFPELARELIDLEYNPEILQADDEKKKYVESYDERMVELERFKGPAVANSYESKTENGSYLLCLSKSDSFENIKATISDYVSRVEKYDEEYGTSFIKNIEKLKKYSEKNTKPITKITCEYSETDKIVKPSNKDYNVYISNSCLKTISLQINSKDNKIYVYVLDCDEDYEKKMKEAANAEIESASHEKTEKEDEFKKKKEELTETLLGFKPSIRNMYNLAFAHMDTFIYSFNDMLKHINTDITNGTRSKNLVETETTKTTIETDLTDYLTDIPPFPALYCTEEKNWAETKTQQKVAKWLEDIGGGFENFEEVRFVNELLSAVLMYTDNVISNEKRKEEMAKLSAGTSANQEQYTNVVFDSYAFIPTTNYDFNNYAISPYANLKNIYLSNEEEAISSTLFIFANRAFYHFLAHPNSENNSAKSFGLLEAYNFYKGVGKPNSQTVKTFVDNLDNIDILSVCTTNTKNQYTNSWHNLGSNFNNTLFTSKNDKELFAALRGKNKNIGETKVYRAIPIGVFTPTEVKSEMGGDRNWRKLSLSDKVLLTDNLPYGSEGVGLSGNTFIINDSSNNVLSNINSSVLGKIDKFEKLKDYRSDAKFLYTDGLYSNITNLNLENSDNIFCDSEGKNIKYSDAIADKNNAYVLKAPLSIPNKKTNINGVDTSTQANNFIYAVANSVLRLDDDQMKKIAKEIKTGTYPKIYLLLAGFMYYGGTYEGNLNKLSIYEPYNHPKQNALTEYYLRWVKKNKSNIEFFINNYSSFRIMNGGYSGSGDFSVKSKLNDSTTRENFKKIQSILRDVLLETVCIVDYCGDIHYYDEKSEKMSYHNSIAKNALTKSFEYFKMAIKLLYEDFSPSEAETYENQQTNDMAVMFENKDLKLSLYLTLKTLYDKWLCAPYKGDDTWNYASQNSDFNTFTYIDTLYNDIGWNLSVNLTSITEWMSQCIPTSNIETTEGDVTYNNASVYEYLARIAQDTGGILMAFPQTIGGIDAESMANMFKAMPYFSNWDTDSSTFVYVYHYKPSEHLGIGQYADDGFQLESDEAEFIFSNNNGNGKKVPGFGVTFAKQNQSYFSNLSLNTENAAVTEASIAATGYIAAKGSTLPQSTTLFGQDLYKVRTSYSYQCEFDMMGNMQVMPLMYFQLNNIPFWNGAYMIYKVSHNITPGNVTTHVAGFRINKYSLPLTDGSVITTRKSYGSGIQSLAIANLKDDEWKIPENPDVTQYDFDPQNVTDRNPVICVVPAHGPNFNNRTAEWWWSNDIVDRLCKLLNSHSFYDGDGNKYNYNVQKCNKDGAFTTHNSCSMTQVQHIIETFPGKVIVYVPHWGNNSRAGSKIYYGGKDKDGEMKIFDGSKMFATILAGRIKDFIDNGEHKHATPGMFIDNTSNPECAKVTTLNDGYLEELTVACPTIAPQFWSDGYPKTEVCKKATTRTSLQVENAPYQEKDENGVYKLSQGWMMSDEGKNAVANISYEAISRFVSSLPYDKNEDFSLND